jgi:hypothetical protein
MIRDTTGDRRRETYIMVVGTGGGVKDGKNSEIAV